MKLLSLVLPLLTFAGLAQAQDCPPNTYRMIVGYGGPVKCVPYAQGSPTNPPPRGRQSTISGPSGSGGGSSGGSVRSAQ
jgi:hypothetical protein